MTAAPFRSCAAAAVLAAASPTQSDPTPIARLLEAALAAPVPVHAAADSAGGDRELWSAGPGWKARFDDGFTFYACDPTREHRPLRWRTEQVAVGAAAIPLGARSLVHGPDRVELRSTGFVERYDVTRAGVEQSFTLLDRPEHAGDLVVTGRVETELRCAPVASACQELVFEDGERPRVRYGRAKALDRDGPCGDVLTAWDGECVRLTVPASIVARARFPLTIDPLTSAVVLDSWTATLVQPAMSIAVETGPTNPRVLVAFCRASSAIDFDAYALVTDLSFSAPTWIFQEVTAGWSTSRIDSSYLGSGQWVLAVQRDGAGTSELRLYAQLATDTGLNTGTMWSITPPAGSVDRKPVLGGSHFGSTALVAWERQAPGVPPELRALRFTPGGSPVLGAQFTIGASTALSDPRVTPAAFSNTGWVLAAASGSGPYVAKVPYTASGNLTATLLTARPIGERMLGIGGLPALEVAGVQDRYLLVYGTTATSGTTQHDSLRTVRFDWSGAAPSVSAQRLLERVSGGPANFARVGLGGLSYDYGTRSHWCACVMANGSHEVVRLGYSGGVVERATVGGLADAAIARPNFQGTFAIAYQQVAGSSVQVLGRRFDYPAAISSIYGSSCGPGATTASVFSNAGHEFYTVNLRGVPPAAPAVYALGTAPGALDLGTLGLPAGCFLNVALPLIGTIAATADASGRATVVYPLPDAPVFLGDVFTQWFWFDGPPGPTTFRAGHGVRVEVR